MEPIRTGILARFARALETFTVSGLDLAFGFGVLIALLLMARGLSWALTIAIVVLTAASVALSALRAGDRLAESERQDRSAASIDGDDMSLSAVIAGLPDAAIILDDRLTVTGSNELARLAIPISHGRHIAQTIRAPEVLQAVDAARRSSHIQSVQLQFAAPIDRTFSVRIIPLGAGDTAGRPALLVFLRDMTEQEQLSRLRADFVANASHELRTPLASLKGFVETLQGAAKDDPAAREQFLGIMQEQASRMSRLIDDLLSLSRIEMREHVPPTTTVDLPAVIQTVTTALAPMARDAGISLTLTGVERPGRVIGDRDEITQVIQNLIQNAIKYGRRSGKVEIALARDGKNYALSVRDDGIGIAPHHLPRLTERFYRVSAKDSRERGGTGLGLAIVKHILTRHRGQLHITSTPGQGSTFTAVLPAEVADE